MSNRSRRPRARTPSKTDPSDIERCQAMSGMRPPVIHRVTHARSRRARRGRGRSREARRAEIDGAFRANSSAKGRRCGTAASCSGAIRCLQAIVSAPAISRPISRASWPGATGAFPTRPCSTVSAWARCAAPTAPSCSAKWASTPSNAGRIYFPSGTPDLDDIRDGAVDIPGSVVRELEEETGLAPGDYRSEPDWHCVFTGPAMAMIRILHVDMPGDALRARIEANLALQRSAGIVGDPSRARHARSHRRDAALCHGLHRGAVRVPTLTCRLRRTSNRPASTWPQAMRLTSGRATNVIGANKNKKTQCTKNHPGRISCRGAKLHACSLGCLPQSRCWGWRFPPRPRKRKSRSA